MTTPHTAPYGSWASPITADLITSGAIMLGQTLLDGDDVYWIEGRPLEGGRMVVVRRTPAGQIRDVTPAPYNARTRVHEYGGGSVAIHNGVVYFSNFTDQRMYRQSPDMEPQPITPEQEYRYADAVVDAARQRLICVREDHTVAGREAVNTLVSLSVEGNTDGGQVLVAGNDFYSSPCISPDGTKLAWLAWNHPNMPWDGTELWVGEFNPDGSLGKQELVVGSVSESIFQPQWSPQGTLYFISDRTNWWNLYRVRNGQIEAVCPKEAEFGVPQWVFGLSSYAFVSEQEMICWYTDQGIGYLARLNASNGTLTPIEMPYTSMSSVRATTKHVAFVGAAPDIFSSIVLLDLATNETSVLRSSNSVNIDTAYFSIAQSIEFPTENGKTAFGFYYAPKNPAYGAPEGERPPLVVMSHGGPTSSTAASLNLSIQFWTTRGFAVLDVNYGGSTGYGREYRQRLSGQWGVVDVDDCINGAKYLVAGGLADENRLAIRGGSAGGYTTLCALTFRDVFKVGASYYGVSDIAGLAQDTHKFESRYDSSLIGPYPEGAKLYRERSPLFFADRIKRPIIFFQGLEDKIVVPNQSEQMVDALRANKIPVAYLAFEGEGHGFRDAKNIKRSLEAELYFYAKILGFQQADQIEPVEIDNL